MLQYSLQDIFTHIYNTKAWGDDETISGSGSRAQEAQGLIHVLPQVMQLLGIQSLLDLGCGDFNWLQYTDLSGVQYYGADIVPELIEANTAKFGCNEIQFLHLDMTYQDLPQADMVMIRDTLTHFSYYQIHRTLKNIMRHDFQYAMISNYSGLLINSNIENGFWRPINLTRAPFHLPPPAKELPEFAEGKSLGIWQMKDLRTLGDLESA